ncbi:MAG: hypothetical protein HeimC2_00460 [Candidatus Heimdallarchaeota archaeon LC_2]|nr:MAG: hypothetical protein HeimC2_00460 [Candidatus Heimdallarchaeota archaeon LC_2]
MSLKNEMLPKLDQSKYANAVAAPILGWIVIQLLWLGAMQLDDYRVFETHLAFFDYDDSIIFVIFGIWVGSNIAKNNGNAADGLIAGIFATFIFALIFFLLFIELFPVEFDPEFTSENSSEDFNIITSYLFMLFTTSMVVAGLLHHKPVEE